MKMGKHDPKEKLSAKDNYFSFVHCSPQSLLWNDNPIKKKKSQLVLCLWYNDNISQEWGYGNFKKKKSEGDLKHIWAVLYE